MPHRPEKTWENRNFRVFFLFCLVLLWLPGCIHPSSPVMQATQAEPVAAPTVRKNPASQEQSTPRNLRQGPSATDSKNSPATSNQPAATSKSAPKDVGVIAKLGPQKWRTLASQPRAEADSQPVKVELAFDNADLYEVLDSTLFELYHVDYMIDPSIKAKVTFHLSGSFTRRQFINIINNVLQLNNLAVVKGTGRIYKIVRRNQSAGGSGEPASRGTIKGSAGDVTRLIKLRYLNAQAAVNSIRPFASRGATMVTSPATNDLIISDTPENIAKIASILSLLDVPYFNEVSWRVFPVKEADAQELATDLSRIVKTNGLYTRPGIDQGSVEIMPIKTLNSLLVVSRWPEMISLVEQWLQALDHIQADTGSNVYVYFVENGTATELADILKQLFGGKVNAKEKNRTTIVKPEAKNKKTPKIAVSGELSGDVDIIPDETNNAIVIKANQRDYQIINKVITQLDVVPRQVLINVMITEIILSGKVQYGIEWFLKEGLGSGYTGHAVLDNKIGRTPTTPLGSASGFTFSVFDSADFLRGLIAAVGTDGGVSILSSPNILAVDNKEAKIEVGEEVPLLTGSVTDATSGSTVTNTIEYRKTGIILKVTPHINSGGLVKMEIVQEVSDKGDFDAALSTYSILNRSLETSLVVQDGQTIVLGGLIKNKKNGGNTGIPYLKDIPILGYLFGSTTQETRKTELVMILTPHVITNREDADRLTREFSQKVRELKDLFEASKVQAQ